MSNKKKEQTHQEPRIYYEDRVIAQALLNKDRRVTTEFYYKGCYPIFQSLWKRFYTDCENPEELLQEVYMMMLYPSKKTGKCQLENYRGESTLRSWIKTIALFYCYKKYKEKPPIVSPPPSSGKIEGSGDRFDNELASINEGRVEMDMTKVIKDDTMCLISLMPNKRYAEVARLFKIEDYTNKEVADALGMTLTNLYNVKLRAMDQFELICRREEQNG